LTLLPDVASYYIHSSKRRKAVQGINKIIKLTIFITKVLDKGTTKKMLLSFGGNEDGQCGRHDFKSEDEEEGYGSEYD
jgi:hypothetical protein